MIVLSAVRDGFSGLDEHGEEPIGRQPGATLTMLTTDDPVIQRNDRWFVRHGCVPTMLHVLTVSWVTTPTVLADAVLSVFPVNPHT